MDLLYGNPLDFRLVLSEGCVAWCCTPCYLNSLSRSVDEYVGSGQCEQDKQARELRMKEGRGAMGPPQQVVMMQPVGGGPPVLMQPVAGGGGPPVVALPQPGFTTSTAQQDESNN